MMREECGFYLVPAECSNGTARRPKHLRYLCQCPNPFQDCLHRKKREEPKVGSDNITMVSIKVPGAVSSLTLCQMS